MDRPGMETQTENVSVIEVRIQRIEQLFNSFDPSPFDERDLDADAETHISGWARELPKDRSFRIVIQMPEDEVHRARERGLAAALASYFRTRADWLERDIRELFRLGWRYLSIGVPVLAACLVLSQVMPRVLGEGPVARIVQESLIIVGWVANWKPIETFLYDWWPLKRRADLYRRLERAEVEIHPL